MFSTHKSIKDFHNPVSFIHCNVPLSLVFHKHIVTYINNTRLSVYYFFNFYFLYISTFFHPHTVHFPVSLLNFAPQCGQICVLATLLITESPLLFTFCFFISFPLLLLQQIANAFEYVLFHIFPYQKVLFIISF